MTHKEFRGTRGALLVGVAALASACSDSPTKPNEVQPVDGVSPLAVISCTGDATSKTISCAPTSKSSSVRGNLILGGQGTYVKLSADPTLVLSANTVTITNVRVQNLLAQPLGTADGVTETADAIRVFFQDLGNIQVPNADGYGNFTGGHQPYFQYHGPLGSGATSEPRDWTLRLVPGTKSFSFLVYVSAAVPHDDQYLRWVSEVTPGPGSYFAAWGPSADDMFIIGSSGRVLHHDGLGYSPMASGTTNGLNDVWGSSSSNVYAVGALATVIRYDGAAWSPITLPGTARTLWDVDGRPDGSAFIAGQASDGTMNRAAVYTNDGSTTWSGPTFLSATANSIAYGVWAASTSEAFAVGSSGQIWHLSDGTWSAMSSPVASNLTGVWGTSPSNVYAVGAANAGTAVLLHYDGSSWTRLPTSISTFLWKVQGSSASNVYAVGGNTGAGTNASILHYDGHMWVNETSPALNQSIYGTFTIGWTNFAVGSNSTILKTSR